MEERLISLAHHFFVILTSTFHEDKGGNGQHLGYDVPPSMANEKFSALVNVLGVQHGEKQT